MNDLTLKFMQREQAQEAEQQERAVEKLSFK